jgi:hypothetical protein
MGLEITPTMLFYEKIVNAPDREALDDINADIQTAILNDTITCNTEIMLLNVAIQSKVNFFIIDDLSNRPQIVTMTMGEAPDDLEEFFSFLTGDSDPEEMQLKKFWEEECEDFKDGNVVPLSDYKGKKK